MAADPQTTEIAHKLGKQITELRVKRGWSQEQLAFETGVHRTHVQRIEVGAVDPSLSTVVRLAVALGVDPAELVRGLGKGIGDPRAMARKRTIKMPDRK